MNDADRRSLDERRRSKLKRMAKEAVEAREANVKEFVESLNPVPIDHKDWVRNETILRKRERELREHRRVRRASEVRRNFAIEEIDVPTQAKDFIVCLRCGDFLPAFAQVSFACSCGHLRVDPTEEPVYNTFVDIAMMRLTPKLTRAPWWRFWERWLGSG